MIKWQAKALTRRKSKIKDQGQKVEVKVLWLIKKVV